MQEVMTSKAFKAGVAALAATFAIAGAMFAAQPAQAVEINGSKAVSNAGTVRIAASTTITASISGVGENAQGSWSWEAVDGASSVTLSNTDQAKVTVKGKADGWATLKATYTTKNGVVDSATAKVKVVGIKSKKTYKGITYKRTGVNTVTMVKSKENAVKKGTYKINTITIGDKSGYKATYKITKIGNKGFQKQRKVTKIVVGANVKTIGNHAFCGAKKLKTLIIGKNVTKIGKMVVHVNCTKLKTLTVKSKKLKSVKQTLKKSKVKTVKVPKAKKAAYKKLFKKCGKKVTVK